MFKKVCIIGCGLIGSSIARAIRKNKLSNKIVSSNRSNITNKKVVKLNIVDEAGSDTAKIAKESDLVIIATPLSSYKDVILKIKNSLKKGAILTDVGSVKKKIISVILYCCFCISESLFTLNLWENYLKIRGLFLLVMEYL